MARLPHEDKGSHRHFMQHRDNQCRNISLLSKDNSVRPWIQMEQTFLVQLSSIDSGRNLHFAHLTRFLYSLCDSCMSWAEDVVRQQLRVKRARSLRVPDIKANWDPAHQLLFNATLHLLRHRVLPNSMHSAMGCTWQTCLGRDPLLSSDPPRVCGPLPTPLLCHTVCYVPLIPAIVFKGWLWEKWNPFLSQQRSSADASWMNASAGFHWRGFAAATLLSLLLLPLNISVPFFCL